MSADGWRDVVDAVGSQDRRPRFRDERYEGKSGWLNHDLAPNVGFSVQNAPGICLPRSASATNYAQAAVRLEESRLNQVTRR